MKTGNKPFVDVIRLRIRLLWLLVAAMIAYVAVVVLLGGGDSRVMNDSAETMYRVIYFGGLAYVGWRIYANKKLLKDRLLRKEHLQKEMDEHRRWVYDKSGGLFADAVLFLLLVTTCTAALFHMAAYAVSLALLLAALALKGGLYLYYNR